MQRFALLRECVGVPHGALLIGRFSDQVGRFRLVFLGYGKAEQDGSTIELTWNWDAQSYDKGNGWGHVAIGVRDAAAECARLEALGVRIVRPAGPSRT